MLGCCANPFSRVTGRWGAILSIFVVSAAWIES